MIDVFISRPTWVAKEFIRGLEDFLIFINSFGFIPKSVGSNVYPTECPLDAVISLMHDCRGAIILGYPQITIEKGYLKDNSIDSVLLATEWNHIEASLAYSLKLPMLIIHHLGVTRGIFELGVSSKFVYEIDFSKPDWFLSENIRGALETWKNAILNGRR